MSVRSLALAALLLLSPLLPVTEGQGQEEARVRLELPPAGQLRAQGPSVTARGVLADQRLRELVRNGFPARLRFRVELWKSAGWFDDQVGATEWDVIVRYDAMADAYGVARIVGDRVVPMGRWARWADAEAAAEGETTAPITPRSGGSHYYVTRLSVETLSLSDLDELERWLRGELRPAVRGRRSPGTALRRGARVLAARMLGGERREYEDRSGTFRP